MSNKQPAYPQAWEFEGNDGTTYRVHSDPGMSLRDWFAGQVLGAVCSKRDFNYSDDVATWAYVIADAMMKARDAQNTHY